MPRPSCILILCLVGAAGLPMPAAEPAAADPADRPQPAEAQDAEMDPRMAALLKRMQQLDWKMGTVAVGAGRAELALPEGYRYLTQADARWVVEELWHNPPDPDTLGLIVPAGGRLIGDGAWAVIVSYDDEGHIDDSDAAKTDFAELLRTMQQNSRAANAERSRQGYPTVDLKGWAEPPHYDSAAKKIYWAKDLRFGESDGDTLNYDVRILGRSGTLVYQAVADIGQLPEVAAASRQLLAGTTFKPGHRYEEYVAGQDKLADYGIAGLVAGGGLLVAKKVGMLAVFGKLAIKFGWLLIFPAMWAWKKFKGDGSRRDAAGSAGGGSRALAARRRAAANAAADDGKAD